LIKVISSFICCDRCSFAADFASFLYYQNLIKGGL